MLYEELKSVINLINENEYSEGYVTFYVEIYKIDTLLSLDFAIKKCLLELEAIDSLEIDIIITSIKHPENELQKLCAEWHIDEKICNKILSFIDGDTKLYRCCDDYQYISRGDVGEIFRIIEKGEERVLIDFYVCD